MKQLKLFTLAIALLTASNTFGQAENVKPISFDQLGKQWSDYEKSEVDKNFLSLYSGLYKETVSVDEMKQAFYKNRNAKAKDKEIHYEDFVVIKPELRPGDTYVRTYPTLKDHPEKKVCEGEKIMLVNPKWYMGFAVSPRAFYEVYNGGKRTIAAPDAWYSDFFAYAAYKPILQLDGPYNWHQNTGWGAHLIGTLHAMRTAEHLWLKGEKQFSVLLYTKTYPMSYRVSYSLELLEPQEPDGETQKLFEDLKDFVEQIPSKAFAPYFTTDLRQMTGRYYRVTVNKCGWLIEDYLNL